MQRQGCCGIAETQIWWGGQRRSTGPTPALGWGLLTLAAAVAAAGSAAGVAGDGDGAGHAASVEAARKIAETG